MFSLQHYVNIARVIHAERIKVKAGTNVSGIAPDAEEIRCQLDAINAVTIALIKLFKEDNPKFRDLLFIAACNDDMRE
jgi:hypothetical protein